MAAGSPFPRTQRIGIFVYDNFEPIDVWDFAEAFSIARFLGTGYSDPPPYPFEIVLISRDGSNVKSINGPSVAPDWDFNKALQEPLDLLMIPGGGGTWPLLDEKNHAGDVAALLDWVHAMDGKARIMASVCTGAAVLARAGLLDGLPAATNHGAFDFVRQFGPKVLWDSGSMPENTSARPAFRPAPTWDFIWSPGWQGGRSRRMRFRPPNMTGTAIPRRRSSIRSRRRREPIRNLA
jgi:putative intracellular protease/amidase